MDEESSRSRDELMASRCLELLLELPVRVKAGELAVAAGEFHDIREWLSEFFSPENAGHG